MILTVITPTYAIKAKRILRNSGINANIVKVDAAKTRNGCTHGLEFDSSYFYDVVSILRKSEIEYSIYK